MADLAMLKAYGELGEECNTVVAQLSLDAAKKALKNAGVPNGLDGDADYDLCVCMLGLHYYDNRGTVSPSEQKEIPLGVQSFVQQLKNMPESATCDAFQSGGDGS